MKFAQNNHPTRLFGPTCLFGSILRILVNLERTNAKKSVYLLTFDLFLFLIYKSQFRILNCHFLICWKIPYERLLNNACCSTSLRQLRTANCELQTLILFSKSVIQFSPFAIHRPDGCAKGQLISECLLGVIDFPKNQWKIWQISALESKKW